MKLKTPQVGLKQLLKKNENIPHPNIKIKNKMKSKSKKKK